MRRLSWGWCTACVVGIHTPHVSPHFTHLPHSLSPHQRGCALPSSPLLPVRCAFRSFHSGLDESRVRRLRQSGITINKPGGRDTLSRAFESRLRVCGLSCVGELYTCVTHPSQLGMFGSRHTSQHDPTHSADSVSEQRRAHRGDVRMCRVLQQKRAAERAAQARNELRVVVVYTLPHQRAHAAMEFPSECPALYSLWPTRPSATAARQGDMCASDRANTTATADKHEDQRNMDDVYNYKDHQSRRCDLGLCERHDTHPHCEHAHTVPPASSVSVSCTTTWHACAHAGDIHLPRRHRKQLCSDGDTTLLLPPLRRTSPSSHLTANSHDTSDDACAPSRNESRRHSDCASDTIRTRRRHEFYTVLCMEPSLHVSHYYSMEAQIELITAYRNILYEAAELPSGPADVVRIPVLGTDTCGSRLAAELDTLTQQSIIKAFHRLSHVAKERLIANPLFTVELYTPPHTLSRFRRTFLNEAWATPCSVLMPHRTALYPGLPPPPSLLHDEGWVGGREELVQAVATEGRSLLRGPHYGLDGRLIEEEDVWGTMRVFGARRAELRMLEAEQASAKSGKLGEDVGHGTTRETYAVTESDPKTVRTLPVS